MEKIEIIARIVRVENKESIKFVTMAVNNRTKKDDEYIDTTTYYSCVFNEKVVLKIGDLMFIRGNFQLKTFTRQNGEFGAAINIFVTESKCLLHKKTIVDENEDDNKNTDDSTENTVVEPF